MDLYDLIERFSIMTVDGNQTEAATLEHIRRAYPETLKNGVYEELLKAIGQKTALEYAETKQEKKAEVADFETLRQYTAEGFTLYAQKSGKNDKGESFRYCVDWRAMTDRHTKGADLQTSAIHTEPELKTAIGNGVMLFAFLPCERNYLCFDIDRGHENGIDGLQVFADYFIQRGVSYNFFHAGAVYTETPSGGRHLYFKDWTDTGKYLADLTENVEVRGNGNGKTLTAAGSVRHGTLYQLHGSLQDAPRLPAWLVKHITPAPKPKLKPPVNIPRNQHGYSLSQLVDFVLQDMAGKGRNDTAYRIGFRIGKLYDTESVIAECMGRELFASFPESELRTAINSGIKNSKN